MDTVNKEWNIKVVFVTFYKFSVTENMKKKVYTDFDEGVKAYGKIAEAIGKISDDKEIVEEMKSNQFSALSKIMSKYKDEVITVLSLTIDGDIDFENIGSDFLQIYVEHFKKFNNDFFKSQVTIE